MPEDFVKLPELGQKGKGAERRGKTTGRMGGEDGGESRGTGRTEGWEQKNTCRQRTINILCKNVPKRT